MLNAGLRQADVCVQADIIHTSAPSVACPGLVLEIHAVLQWVMSFSIACVPGRPHRPGARLRWVCGICGQSGLSVDVPTTSDEVVLTSIPPGESDMRRRGDTHLRFGIVNGHDVRRRHCFPASTESPRSCHLIPSSLVTRRGNKKLHEMNKDVA